MRMPIRRVIVGAIAGVGLAGLAALADSNQKHATTSVTTAQVDRKIEHYRHPMGLPDVSTSPKKDSMGMDYIAVYEGDDSDDGSVKVSPGKIQRTGVKSEPAARRVIRTMIRAPGAIQLDERRVSVIAMRAESYVQKVADVTTGAHVVKGQPLMEIYSPAMSSAAAEYISTLNSKVTGGDGSYGRGSRQRLMNLDMPDAAIVAMEKSRNVPIGIEWTSPRNGIVLERNVIEGMRAQPGETLFRIADHSVVWAIMDVAERDLGSVVVGQRALVRARSFPGANSRGRSTSSTRRSTRRRAQRACASNCPIRNCCCFTTCMSMPKSTPAARMPSSPFPKARCWTPAAGRPCWSTRGKGGSSRVKSSSAIAAGDMSRSARASPRTIRWWSRPIS